MSYLTKESLIEYFGTEEVEDVTDERFALILSSVDERINDAVRRYLPFLEAVPPLLTAIAVDIARYDVVSDGRIYDETRLKGLRDRYLDALKLLELIKSGALLLGLDELGMGGPVNTVEFTSKPRPEY